MAGVLEQKEAAGLCAALAPSGGLEGSFIAAVDALGGNKGVILSFTWAHLAAAILAPPLNLPAIMPVVTAQ